MELNYSSNKVDDVLILTIHNENVNHEITPKLKEVLLFELASGSTNMVLDFSEVSELDSSGLGAILFGKRQVNSQNGELCLANVNATIQNMIRIAQLSRVVDIYDSVDDAVDSLQE